VSLSVTQIPGIMRANGWTEAAKLLDKWFADPANSTAAAGRPDTTTVTMDWVLGFSRAKVVFDEIKDQKLWVNEAARKQIVTLLMKLGKLQQRKVDFGDLAFPVPTLNNDYIQFRAVGNMLTDPIDGLFAALGRFVFRVAVKGSVSPQVVRSTLRYEVQITDVGIYVYDIFDFSGFQPLGFWNPTTNYAGRNPFHGTLVTNKDFRDWRDNKQLSHGKGGDFLVFSDLKTIHLSSPDTFLI
jgi:Family of unknown function (DUF6402)